MPFPASRAVRLSIPLLLINLTILVNAQNNAPAADPGPRNPGTVPFPFPVLGNVPNCPLPQGTQTKFNSPGLNCIDFDQPPSQPPQPAADGAGNLIGENNTNVFTQPLAAMWFQGLSVFETVASVNGLFGNIASEQMPGLGPMFNSQSCFHCHSQPTVGGSSPGIITINTPTGSQTFTSFSGTQEVFLENPEIIDAKDDGASNNPTPSFLPINVVSGPGFSTVPANGPVIEVRFVNGLAASGNAAAIQTGAVGELYTFAGRGDEPANCSISQLTFTGSQLAFRIPTPTYGLGLVENTPELILQSNLNTTLQSSAASALGIAGTFNRSGNDGTITRFGWKAQNKSLLIFAGEASNVEMGVTNELFPDEKSWGSGLACISNTTPGYPEDQILTVTGTGTPPDPSLISSSAENNAVFMRMNAAPSQCDALLATVVNGIATCPPFSSNQVLAGQGLFNSATLGCAICHTPTLTTGPSANSFLNNQTYHPYSDFALHHMGPGLADGVNQGSAGSDQFRTAPLWGAGQRYFFLHDGRANDLLDAILDHCPNSQAANTVGEACKSVKAFQNLTGGTNGQQQAVLDFLRSL
jgi:CxxC motif-containing protein (DUF1111 family)